MRDGAAVAGVFERREDAEVAVRALAEAGFRRDDLGLLLRRNDADRPAADVSRAGPGLALGAIVGVVEGIALEATVLAFPPGAGFIAGGTLVAAIAGAAVGAGAGAVSSALVRMGIADPEARSIEDELHGERALVTVSVTDPILQERARRLLRVQGAIDTRSVADEDEGPSFVPGFADVVPRLQEHWRARLAARGEWRGFEPKYRFGWQRANRPDFAGRAWDDASNDVRAEWERRNPDRAWHEVAEAIEAGWKAAREQRSQRGA